MGTRTTVCVGGIQEASNCPLNASGSQVVSFIVN